MVFSDRCSGIAHSRPSIIDLSPMGHQPMFSHDSSVVISFNGEIYNYLDIRTELISSGIPFRGDSDTEVLVNLFSVLPPVTEISFLPFKSLLRG